MTSIGFQLQGETLIPDPAGALYLPDHKTLVVSDLHFEKGSAFAQRGVMLPPYDTRATLALIERMIEVYQPCTVISLGDSFHDCGAEARMSDADSAMLISLTSRADWVWVLGNHDPEPPKSFAGSVTHRHELGSLHFQHEASPVALPGEVSGHYHPCARIFVERRAMRRRCFIRDEYRLILPAMGALTGGLNVLDMAIRPLFGDKCDIWALGRDRVFSISEHHLLPDVISVRA